MGGQCFNGGSWDSGQRELKPISEFREDARFWRKRAVINAITAGAGINHFALFAQNYAVRGSDFVRKDVASSTLSSRARGIVQGWITWSSQMASPRCAAWNYSIVGREGGSNESIAPPHRAFEQGLNRLDS